MDLELRRPVQPRVIAGVCAGLADRLGVDATLVRVVFVLASVFGSGLGLLAYVILWAVVPEEDSLEDVIAGRLERGEITAEEYRLILSDIESSGVRPARKRR